MPAWIEHAVFWHLYPLGFVGADIRPAAPPLPAHRLDHLLNWLDYAVELGASALLLGPIFASATHGYDTTDHFRIDPRLGDEADFDRLVAEAQARGLRVVLDGVFNHVGRSHPFVRDALEHGGSSPKASWFRYTPEGELATFEGHHGLVALNGENPEVEDYVRTVMTHWLDRGIAGWRLDAAYAMAPDFWGRVLPGVRDHHPDAFIFAEMIHGDYAGFVQASGVDSVTQYELWKAIWSALNDKNFFELSWALDRHNGFLDHFIPQTFVGNHDVTRLASRLDDVATLEHALAVLAVVGGIPSVYAGDEQAFHGIKTEGEGGDDAVRPAFPERPQDLWPDGWPIYHRHQELIGLRRRHPWLVRARSKTVLLENTRLVLELADAGRRLFFALNLGGPTSFSVPDARGVLAGRDAHLCGAGHDARLHLAEKGWAVLSTALC
ncbi:alpha-amylase [Martelella lutilitoris]|uniref:Alpha-amylase n=1 Tax=Martelella lutilitoris TaxID=2583532 RepID=A0A5C4JTD2_9HYPH|nr:alpha-amylase [Martelella lutilitoris]